MYDFACRLFIVGFMSLACGVARPAADVPRPNAARAAFRDLQLSVHARVVLHDDAILAPWNIGVSVKDGVATLWGSAPSIEVIEEARKRLESVQGILDVHSEMFVARQSAKPNPLILAAPAPDESQRTESASPDFWSGVVRSPPGRTTGLPTSLGGAAKTESTDESNENLAGIGLLPPVSSAAGEMDGSGPAEANRPMPPAEAWHPDVLPMAVERLRRSQARFAGLRTDVEGNTVTLTGPAILGDEMMALALLISRQAGVNRVVTKTIAADNP